MSNPLPAAIGLTVLDVVEQEGLVTRSAQAGDRLKHGLEVLQQRFDCIGDIRGRGLMVGLEVVRDRQTKTPDHELGVRINEEAMARGISMNIVKLPNMGSVFRLAPPLTIFDAEIEIGIEILGASMEAALA